MTGEAFARPTSLWAAMARPSCECGGLVQWHAAHDLPWHVAPGDRVRAFQLVTWCGHDADAWTCSRCGNWGVFEQ